MLAIKVFVLLALNAIDLLLAMAMYRAIGKDFELNPIARAMLGEFGFSGIALLKIGAIGIVAVAVFFAIKRKQRELANFCLDTCIGISVVGAGLSLHSFS